MKALKYNGVKNVELVDIPVPEPGAGQVLVVINYRGICGTNVHAYSYPGTGDFDFISDYESV